MEEELPGGENKENTEMKLPSLCFTSNYVLCCCEPGQVELERRGEHSVLRPSAIIMGRLTSPLSLSDPRP